MQKYLYKDLYLLEDKHWWHISKRRAVSYLIQKYTPGGNLKILDIGCGTGRNIEELQKFGNVYGIDSSTDALRYCKKRGLKNINVGNAEKTLIKSGSFDIVSLLDVLEHTDDNKTLQEMQRILKKNGLIIITVPAFSWLWSKWDEVLHHKRRYDKAKITAILLKNNFTPIYTTYLYSYLVLPAVIIRKVKQRLSQKGYTSDFQLSNQWINKIMSLISNIEFQIAQKVSIPIGTSIFIVAKK